MDSCVLAGWARCTKGEDFLFDRWCLIILLMAENSLYYRKGRQRSP